MINSQLKPPNICPLITDGLCSHYNNEGVTVFQDTHGIKGALLFRGKDVLYIRDVIATDSLEA